MIKRSDMNKTRNTEETEHDSYFIIYSIFIKYFFHSNLEIIFPPVHPPTNPIVPIAIVMYSFISSNGS